MKDIHSIAIERDVLQYVNNLPYLPAVIYNNFINT